MSHHLNTPSTPLLNTPLQDWNEWHSPFLTKLFGSLTPREVLHTALSTPPDPNEKDDLAT
jgi:hypothetical protein